MLFFLFFFIIIIPYHIIFISFHFISKAVRTRVGKIETGLHILMKAGGNVSSNLSEELDALKRAQRKLQKELDSRDKEISKLKTTLNQNM